MADGTGTHPTVQGTTDVDRNDTVASDRPYVAQRTDGYDARTRGGFSFWSVLTGVAVAMGTMVILGAIVGGIAAAIAGEVDATIAEAGIAVGIAFVVTQLLAYLWGGYTAGRMARGAGLLNGILVPVLALVLAGIAGAIVAALVPEAADDVAAGRLPIEGYRLDEFGVGIAIASVAAMVIGGAWGGIMGSRWHDKLEDRADLEVGDSHRT